MAASSSPAKLRDAYTNDVPILGWTDLSGYVLVSPASFLASQLQPHKCTDQRNQQKDRQNTITKQQIETFQLGMCGGRHEALSNSLFL
jgi:hypothetical protein